MAEANFNDFDATGAGARVSGSRTMAVIGALTTLALLVGVGVWGYRLAVRDASGVPIIQALEGPFRAPPEDPGGRIAPHTGLSLNRIAADGTSAPVPDQIVLAPAPVALSEEDLPGVGEAAPPQVVEEDTMARTLALAEELAQQVAAELAAMDTSAALTEALAAEGSAPSVAPHLSLRPQPRPAGLIAARAPAQAAPQGELQGITSTSTASAASDVMELASTAIAPGTRLAQIGAFDDIETARAEWQKIVARHPALFDGKQRVIQTASSVGRTFYRLRVSSFASEDDTRRFCAAISAGDLRCISVIMR